MAQRAPKRKNLGHEVFETLKLRILNWEYPPGRRLIEEELCQEFGVSRSPVREALGRLAAYGLVEYEPHKGCQVKQLELRTIKDLYQVRLALELWVAERLAQDPDVLPALARLRADWTAPRHRSVEQWAELDRQFHEGLARAAGNAVLVSQLEAVNERLTVLRPFDFSVEERAVSTCAQHLDVLDRIAAGDPEGARRAIRVNIEDSLGNVERVVGEFLAKAYLGVKPAG
ncbi:GntR family transcriptional regulator [Fundidesulfovibrio butyratiphilus]